MTAHPLLTSLSAATHPTLAIQLFDEAAKLEQALALKRWQHTELDGGRFAEVAARMIYGVDSGAFNLGKGAADCFSYIENPQATHAFPDQKSAHQLVYVLRSIYKIRSQRGAVHVSPDYTANEIDSRLVVEGVRWSLAELLRVFVTSNQSELVASVRELSRFPHPLIRNYGGQALVQSVGLTAEEEVLVHLLHDEEGLEMSTLVRTIPKDPSTVRRAVRQLSGGGVRQVIGVSGKWHITDLGIQRIEHRLLEVGTRGQSV